MNTEITPLTACAPRARASHPQTSHDAAASVTNLTGKQQAVLKVAKCLDGGFTLEGLVNTYHGMRNGNYGRAYDLPLMTDSSIRTRCSELVKIKLVEPTEETRIMSTGRKAVVWRAA